jgi:hypothetical protein
MYVLHSSYVVSYHVRLIHLTSTPYVVHTKEKAMINDLTTIALRGIEHCLVYQPLILSSVLAWTAIRVSYALNSAQTSNLLLTTEQCCVRYDQGRGDTTYRHRFRLPLNDTEYTTIC